jgi:hypothetical protein
LSWEVSEQKVRLYLLNINHPIGGAKARFFLARGFTLASWQGLGAALREHPVNNPIEGEQRTVWMMEFGTPARLVTAYPSTD